MGARALAESLERRLRGGAARLPWSVKEPLRWVVDPGYRRRQREQKRQFEAFTARHAALLADPRPLPEPRGTLLLATNGVAATIQIEMVLAKSLQMAGFRPVVLGWRDPAAQRYFAAWGMGDSVAWEDYLPAEPADSELEEIRSFEDLLAFERHGARVGKYAASWAMRRFRICRVDPSEPESWRLVLEHVRSGLRYAHAAREVLRVHRPSAALLLEHGYSPWGELFDQCVAAGVDTLQWNGCHKDNAVMLKRYHRGNTGMHPASISPGAWQRILALPWTGSEAEALRHELHHNYATGGWFSEVGTQFEKTIVEKTALAARLGLDPARKTAVVFPHMFWDATFFYGRDLFRDYEEWFVEAMRAAVANPALNWVVKIHPANVVKDRRDGVRGEGSEKAALRQRVGTLPPHVRLIEADSDISTYSLFALMDYALTVRGTVGIEAASFGVRVLTAGTGRYDHLGFTLDSETPGEYLERLRHLHEVPPMTAAEHERAQRYAHAVFCLRPLPLTSARLEYERDAAATPRSAIELGSLEELGRAADLQAFTRWALDRDQEDFLWV